MALQIKDLSLDQLAELNARLAALKPAGDINVLPQDIADKTIAAYLEELDVPAPAPKAPAPAPVPSPAEEV